GAAGGGVARRRARAAAAARSRPGAHGAVRSWRLVRALSRRQCRKRAVRPPATPVRAFPGAPAAVGRSARGTRPAGAVRALRRPAGSTHAAHAGGLTGALRGGDTSAWTPDAPRQRRRGDARARTGARADCAGTLAGDP